MSSKVELRSFTGYEVVHVERIPVAGEIIRTGLGSPCLVIQVAHSQERTVVWASRIEDEAYRFAHHMYDEEAGVPHQNRLGYEGWGKFEPK